MHYKMIFLNNSADNKALIDKLELLDKRVYKTTKLSGRYLRERKALDAVSLNCNSSVITDIANDYSFGDVFARQVEAHGKKGDVLFAISTSGNSLNIINALSKARDIGLVTIGLTGLNGGKMRELTDLMIDVPSSSTPRIQDAHLLIEHTICEIIESMVCEGATE